MQPMKIRFDRDFRLDRRRSQAALAQPSNGFRPGPPHILFADDQDTSADLVGLNSLSNQLDRSTGKSHIGWNGFLNYYPNIVSRAAAIFGARNLFRLKARP